MSRGCIAELAVCLKRLLCASAARAAVCSSVRSEHYVFPLNVMTPRSRHLELEVCVTRYRIEFCKCGSPEQCVIATVERDDIEDQLLASEVVRRSKDHFQCD